MPSIQSSVSIQSEILRVMPERDQEIINSVRRAYEAFSRADFDTAIEIAHPDVEFVPPGGQTSLKGADAMRAWMEPDAIEEQQARAARIPRQRRQGSGPPAHLGPRCRERYRDGGSTRGSCGR